MLVLAMLAGGRLPEPRGADLNGISTSFRLAGRQAAAYEVLLKQDTKKELAWR